MVQKARLELAHPDPSVRDWHCWLYRLVGSLSQSLLDIIGVYVLYFVLLNLQGIIIKNQDGVPAPTRGIVCPQ